MSELPFDQAVTALRNWSRGVPDIRARDPESLATRVLDALAAATQRAEAERAVIEAAKAHIDDSKLFDPKSYLALVAAVATLREMEARS